MFCSRILEHFFPLCERRVKAMVKGDLAVIYALGEPSPSFSAPKGSYLSEPPSADRTLSQ